MGTTPTFGLPYPEPTDPVAAGADNIKALALAVDPKLPSGWIFNTNIADKLMVAGGSGAYSTDASGFVTIPFGVPFAGNPIALVNSGDGGGKAVDVNVTGITPTAVTAYCRWTTTAAPVGNDVVLVVWMAIGQRP